VALVERRIEQVVAADAFEVDDLANAVRVTRVAAAERAIPVLVVLLTDELLALVVQPRRDRDGLEVAGITVALRRVVGVVDAADPPQSRWAAPRPAVLLCAPRPRSVALRYQVRVGEGVPAILAVEGEDHVVAVVAGANGIVGELGVTDVGNLAVGCFIFQI
jgi:hypothetical protein